MALATTKQMSREQRKKMKQAKVLIEAYQAVLKMSGFQSVFVLGEIGVTTKNGIKMHSGKLVVSRCSSSLPGKSTESSDDSKSDVASSCTVQSTAPTSDVVEIVMNDCILKDFESDSYHRITRVALEGALLTVKNNLLKQKKPISDVYKECMNALTRFYPEKQRALPILQQLSIKLLESKDVYAFADLTPHDIPNDFGTGMTLRITKGVRVTIFVGEEPVSGTMFIGFKPFGEGVTAANENSLYNRHCENPTLSPTNLYNAILAYWFNHEPKTKEAKMFVEYVKRQRKF